MHMANFVVVERECDGALIVLKERYEIDVRHKEISHKELFQHAIRHLAVIRKDSV
jgi:hypothetical protein